MYVCLQIQEFNQNYPTQWLMLFPEAMYWQIKNKKNNVWYVLSPTMLLVESALMTL